MTANKKLRERLTDWTAGTVTRVDAYGREIRVGDVVRYVRNHDERRVVAHADVWIEDGEHARHEEDVDLPRTGRELRHTGLGWRQVHDRKVDEGTAH